MSTTQLSKIQSPSALAVMASKSCKSCGLILPLDQFYLKGNGSDRRDSRCRICRAAEVRMYRAQNPEIVKAIQKRTCAKHAEKHRARASKWYRENHQYAKEQMAARRREKPETIKNEKLRLSFGITLSDYNKMMEAQKDRCAICGIHNSDCKRSLAVDHCHTTGRVRGLLCGKCNSAIGLMNESTEVLKNAISYLENQ